MVRGRRDAKRKALLKRQIEQRERDFAVARTAKKLVDKYGDERGALARLSANAGELQQLHKQEAKLLRERDELVGDLRQTGNSWASLSARTGLSRQALMKRSTRKQTDSSA